MLPRFAIKSSISIMKPDFGTIIPLHNPGPPPRRIQDSGPALRLAMRSPLQITSRLALDRTRRCYLGTHSTL